MNTTPDRPKHIIVCADDFGMNPDIDVGILRLAQLGRLSATSCLVEGPQFRRNAAALKYSPLQTGVHLNFTEELDVPGLFLPVSTLIMRAYAHRLDKGQVRAQIARQLDAFEDVMGRVPDFVDGHQHVHQLPQIRDAVLSELVQRYTGSPLWLRYTGMRAQPTIPIRLRFKASIIQALGARRFARQTCASGFALNPGFLGVYDFHGGADGYRALLQSWLRHACDGDLLMCHPAARVNMSDGLGEQRAAEYEVLASEAAGQWLEEFGLHIAQPGARAAPASLAAV